MSKGASATSQASVKAAKAELSRFLKKVETVPIKVLEVESQTLYAEIIAETPFKTGKLEESVKVSVSRSKTRPGLLASASARSSRGYNYAGIQHRKTQYHHPIKGKAHYISDPFSRATKRIVDQIDRKMTLGG